MRLWRFIQIDTKWYVYHFRSNTDWNNSVAHFLKKFLKHIDCFLLKFYLSLGAKSNSCFFCLSNINCYQIMSEGSRKCDFSNHVTLFIKLDGKLYLLHWGYRKVTDQTFGWYIFEKKSFFDTFASFYHINKFSQQCKRITETYLVYQNHQCKFFTGNKHVSSFSVPALLVAHYEMINKSKLKNKMTVCSAFDYKILFQIIDRRVIIELRCGHFFQSIKCFRVKSIRLLNHVNNIAIWWFIEQIKLTYTIMQHVSRICCKVNIIHM